MMLQRPWHQRFTLRAFGGGTILYLGIYMMQFVLHVFGGEKPETVKASGLLNSDGVDVTMSATFTFKSGRTATIVTSNQVTLPNEGIVIGTEGTIKVPQVWSPTTLEYPGGIEKHPLPKSKYKFNFAQSEGLGYEANHVRDCLIKG